MQPSDSGRSVIKYTAIWNQGCWGMDRRISLPEGIVWGTLVHWMQWIYGCWCSCWVTNTFHWGASSSSKCLGVSWPVQCEPTQSTLLSSIAGHICDKEDMMRGYDKEVCSLYISQSPNQWHSFSRLRAVLFQVHWVSLAEYIWDSESALVLFDPGRYDIVNWN